MGLINRVLVKIFEPNAHQRLEEILNNARQSSKTGNFDYVSSQLNLAKQRAIECELPISDGELSYIKYIAGMIETNNLLENAKKSADEGYVPGAVNAFNSIKELHKKINNKEFPPCSVYWWESTLINLAYRNGIERYFKCAESSIKEGWCGNTWHLLYRAEFCAKKAGIDISSRILEFRAEYAMATYFPAPIQKENIKELIEPCFFDD